jgi:hypothetical protein
LNCSWPCRDAEELIDEENLTQSIAFDQPWNSPFPDHVHGFNALQRHAL